MLMGEITGVATNLMTSGNSFPFLTSVFHCIHVSISVFFIYLSISFLVQTLEQSVHQLYIQLQGNGGDLYTLYRQREIPNTLVYHHHARIGIKKNRKSVLTSGFGRATFLSIRLRPLGFSQKKRKPVSTDQ